MRKMPILALGAMLLTAGCYDAYGNVDPGRTALLGAGVGAAAGLGIAAASQPRYDYGPTYYAPPRRYYRPRARYYRGPPARYYRGPPPRYYRGPPPRYDRRW